MKLTKKEAKALSIKKWEIIIKNGGDYESRDLPEGIQDLTYYCGYCEKYNPSRCIGCPLNLPEIGGSCVNSWHPWSTWARNKTKTNAQAVLDLIRKS